MLHKGDKGTIEYKLPTVPESLELWGRMGMEPSQLADEASPIHNSFILMSKTIANMGHLITKVDYKFGDRIVKDYESLCKEMGAMTDLCAVAGRIIEAMNGGSEDKKKS